MKVRYTANERSRLSDLDQVRIRTAGGLEVPLMSVADVTFTPGYSTITRTDGMRRVAVSAGVDTNKANANEIFAEDNGPSTYSAFDNDDGVNEFMLSGDNDLTITARQGFDLSASSDLRGFTESVNFDASDFTANLRIAGSVTDDAIAGGSGNKLTLLTNSFMLF